MIKEILIIAVLYYWFLAVSKAEMIKARSCKKSQELEVRGIVNEIKLQPCPSPGGGSCELYRGTNATVTVKFTPSEAASISSACKLNSKLVWVSKIEMDFGGISSNACDYMKCPLEPNSEHVFNATFFVSKMWPTGSFPLKLKIQEKSGPKRLFLCQLFKVRLTDKPADEVLS